MTDITTTQDTQAGPNPAADATRKVTKRDSTRPNLSEPETVETVKTVGGVTLTVETR